VAALIGIDFSQDGKQCGHLAIPHSTHISAYGKIIIPVVYIRNGDGPRAFLSAGIHGDEYEGQIALRNLCLNLVSDDVKGSLLILPMMNAPAVCSSSRVSPIDHINMNRAFPGNSLGSPTAAIASAIENQLLEGCRFAYDIHSGGSSLLYDAVALTTSTGSVKDDEKRLNLLRALGLEAGMLLPVNSNMGLESSLDGAMLRKSVIGVSAEFGGGGVISAKTLRKCEQSIRRFLAHVGLTKTSSFEPADRQCQIYDIGDPDAHVFSESIGLFKAEVAIGSVIGRGDVIGRIYDFYDLNSSPKVVRSNLTGKVLAIRTLPRVEIGDCLAQIGKLSGTDREVVDAT